MAAFVGIWMHGYSWWSGKYPMRSIGLPSLEGYDRCDKQRTLYPEQRLRLRILLFYYNCRHNVEEKSTQEDSELCRADDHEPIPESKATDDPNTETEADKREPWCTIYTPSASTDDLELDRANEHMASLSSFTSDTEYDSDPVTEGRQYHHTTNHPRTSTINHKRKAPRPSEPDSRSSAAQLRRAPAATTSSSTSNATITPPPTPKIKAIRTLLALLFLYVAIWIALFKDPTPSINQARPRNSWHVRCDDNNNKCCYKLYVDGKVAELYCG